MLLNYLDNLNIRNKLIIFLLIPVLTILYFSISGIYLKFQEQQNAKKSQDFIAVSLRLDDLVHELQKERGLSAGFVGSIGKLHSQDLRLQRQLTNEKLKFFSLELTSKNSDKSYWGLSDTFNHTQLKLQKLPAIRAEIDSIKAGDFFDDYSEIITLCLTITKHLQVVSSNAVLVRQSDAFSALLLLQERSGQERGLLNAVFTSGDLNAEHIKKFSAYISEQDSLISNFYTIASSKQKSLLLEKMKQPEAYDVGELRTAVLHKASRNDRLNSLLNLIGYGGLIHDFKNNVIRGQQRYVDRFNKMHVAVSNIIKEYQELPGISDKEVTSLNIIKSTLLKYRSLLEVTKRLREESRTINEIDLIVKVNDKPALDAIKYLHKSVTGLDTSKWWDKATIRINSIREVSNVVRADIIEQAKQNLKTTARTLYIYITLTLVSLMISFILGYRIMHRLIGGIINIESHMSRMHTNGEFDDLLVVTGNDEISKVAESFNNLINERSKYEEQLRLAALVFDKTSEAMVVTDADNHFLTVNSAFTHITGYSLDDITGSTPAILQSGKQDKEFYKEMWDSLQQKGYWSGEILNRRKNGEIYTEWLNINVIKDKQGTIIKHIAMFTDITERKLYEEKQENLKRQLLQAQKMEALGQLTGGIAHDFNNMLSAILGYTDLAMLLNKDNVKLSEYLNEVTLAGNRAKDLIAQMLSFSRGGKDIERELLDIKPLLEESITMIRPLLPSTIEFETHFSSDVNTIIANPIMIHQIIMNLCINARDAITEHGRIDFYLKFTSINNEECISCHMPIKGNYLEVSIQDTGSGIEPKIINNLFDPFFSTKEMGNEKGTGMGLAMVHGIMHEHNGHIIVESSLGKGTKFRLLFPLAVIVDGDKSNNTKDVTLVDAESRNKADGLNILVVDDEASIVSLLKEVLSSHGFNVTGFTDSELALSHFKENTKKYDIVITDQTMPNLTGAELSKSLISIQPDISIILCTGYSERLDEKNAQNVGIKTYLNKPVSMKKLLSTITQLVG